MRTRQQPTGRRAGRVVVAATATAAVLAACGGAPADPGGAVVAAAGEPSASASTSNPGVHDSTPEEQRQADIDSLREFFPDITDEEAVAHMAAQEATAQLAYVLESEHRESFAYSEATGDERYAATIHFKNAPSEALALVEDAHIPGVVVDNSAKYTKDEQLALTAAAFDPIAQRGLTTSMSGGYDPRLDLVTIEVEPKPGLDVATVVAGAPSVIALPGVVDAAGRPAQTPVVYGEGAVSSDVGGAGAGSSTAPIG